MSQELYPINIWINEERYERLQRAGLADIAKDVLAGLKVIPVHTTVEQRDTILKRFPQAKCDTATTKTIELLPRVVKDSILDLVLEKKSTDVMSDFLEHLE